MLRIYDKGVEQRTDEPGTLWRLELEAKRSLAQQVCQEIQKADDPASYSLSRCSSSLQSAGGRSLSVLGLPDSALPPLRAGSRPAMLTDADRMLAYVQQFVRPMAWKLREMGKLKELLEALDLPELVRLDPAVSGEAAAREPKRPEEETER